MIYVKVHLRLYIYLFICPETNMYMEKHMSIPGSALRLLIALSLLSLFENLLISADCGISGEYISMGKDAIHAGIIIFFLLKNRKKFQPFTIRKPQKNFIIISVALGLVLLFLGSEISDLILHFYPDFYSQNPDAANYSTMYFLYFLIYASILAPVIEEIEFRRFPLDQISSDSRPKAFFKIIITALMFFAIHTDQFNFGALCLGIVSGFMYYYTGNLLYSIVIHLSGNLSVCLLTVLASVIGSNSTEISEDIEYTVPGFGFTVSAICVLAFFVFLLLHHVSKNTTREPHTNTDNSAVAENGAANLLYMIIYFAICALSTAVALKRTALV